MSEPRPPPHPPLPCPICGKRPTVAQKPFCSDRCRQVDLGRWLSDAYVIPGDPIQDSAEIPEG